MLLLVAGQLLVDDAVCVSLDSLIVLDVLDDHSVGVLLVLLDCTVDVDDENDEGENDDDDDEGDDDDNDDDEEWLLEESAEVEDEDDDGDDDDDELLLTEVDALDKIEDELGTSTSSSARSSVFVHSRAKP